MDADSFQPDRYQDQVQSLIATVEDRLQAVAGDDRESRLQRAAFIERCERARAVARRLQAAGGGEQSLLEGDALRCLEALRLSRAFFSDRARPTA